MTTEYAVRKSSKFLKDYKRLSKRGYDMRLIDDVILKLASGKTLDARHADHPMRGKYAGFRNCHIKGDWIMLYEIIDGELLLYLSETGTHSDILGL